MYYKSVGGVPVRLQSRPCSENRARLPPVRFSCIPHTELIRNFRGKHLASHTFVVLTALWGVGLTLTMQTQVQRSFPLEKCSVWWKHRYLSQSTAIGTTAAFSLGLVWEGFLEETKIVTLWRKNRGRKPTPVSGEMAQPCREHKRQCSPSV